MVLQENKQKYVKLTQLEHIRARPNMYISDPKPSVIEDFVLFEKDTLVKKNVKFSLGLYKIFDEAFQNAIDQSVKDKTLKNIKVDIDKKSGSVSVFNDGIGIPVEIDEKEGVYIPEMVFGSLLTSSNYNDSEDRIVGGVNGLGVKCISLDTKVLLFNGDVKLAKDIKIGDILIGDDGTERNVSGVLTGEGRMFEISQSRGESYKVNEEHTLTLHMPDHKVVFWNNRGWSMLWWDNGKVNTKFIEVFKGNVVCKECGIELHKNGLKRHYSRIHKHATVPKKPRSPPSLPNMKNDIVLEKYNEMKRFSDTIKSGAVIDITIKEYMNLPKTIQKRLAGIRGKCVEWSKNEVLLDPYVLGLWLGDGYTDGYRYACDGENDFQVMDYLKNWGKKNDANFKQAKNNRFSHKISSIDNYGKKGKAPLKKLLDKYNLVKNKHIPREYLVNSRDVRLKLLAGLIDSDGSLMREGTRIVISQCAKHYKLIEGIAYLARSLGFSCSLKPGVSSCNSKIFDKYTVNISGDICDIPTLIPRKKCAHPKKQNTGKTCGQIRINEIKNGGFIGIKVDRNERFLINDFTVTHNCTNVFSESFKIEVADGKKLYEQTFSNGMTEKTKPSIRSRKANAGYVRVTFIPELKLFSMKKLSDTDILEVIYSRIKLGSLVLDKRIKLQLNGEGINYDIKSLSKTLSDSVVYEENKDWEVAVVYDYELTGSLSFVNGIQTLMGGKHVEYILNQLVKKISASSKTKIKAKDIRDRVFIIVRATVKRPSFSSQSKEFLTTSSKDFGYTLDLSDKFIKKFLKTGIVQDIKLVQNVRQDKQLKKMDGKKSSKIRVPKLDDANFAGTSKSEKCTLILTEGDSAKTFAVSGLSVIGRDYYGVFPLKGKALNVREATKKQLLENEEFNNLKKIMGLQQGKVYDDLGSLRYGKIIILTDADSVTFDTPCLLKNIETGEIEIKPICEANNGNWDTEVNSGKEYSFCDRYLTWTDKGWSKIKGVMRHKIDKPIKRILTHTGCVDVTEDHSLLDNLGNPITSRDCKIKETQLLHARYTQETIMSNGITPEYAYALGYFQADGNCCIDSKLKQIRKNGSVYHTTNNRWTITCVDIEPLEKLKEIFEKYESNEQEIKITEFVANQCEKCFKIFNTSSNYAAHKLIKRDCSVPKKTTFVISKRKVGKDSFSKKSGREFKYILEAKNEVKIIAEKFRKMFYNSIREKIVPKEILNNTVEVQQSFIDGFYAGDGKKGERTTDSFDGEYKSQIMGLFQVLQNCGYSPSLNCSSSKLNVYHVLMGGKEGRGFHRPKHTVKKILDVSEKYANTYVYDFETENHHFHGSIGNMIVKNCDGVHIQGLVINIFSALWPSLLKHKGFLSTMRTPIVKATKGKIIHQFYSVGDYNDWKKTNNPRSWNIKYYKGLGTSTAAEAKEYFKIIDNLQVDYFSTKHTDSAIKLAFEKKNADKRKEWILNSRPVETDTSLKISYDDFINNQLIDFSIYDIHRSIPSLVDGFKPSQRKVMYTALKTNLTKEYKVAQFAGEIAKESGYHHGEASLMGTIIGMAQNYVGSNNINLLEPIGQFGTRLQQGKDAASPRYIFTKMEDISTFIFDKNDLNIIKYLDDDGVTIEPEYYVPVIPMILVNGAAGIGTGFSTKIPSFNPVDIIENIKRMMSNKPLLEMLPYYKGFKGNVEKISDTKYETSGVYKKLAKKIIISELPVGKSTDDYIEHLNNLIENGLIKDYKNNSTEEIINITVDLVSETVPDLKMTSNLNISNMYLFDRDNRIKKYGSIDDILKEYYDVRLDFYKKRKVYLLNKLGEEIKFISNKLRFLELIINKKLVVFRVPKKELEKKLKELDFDTLEGSYGYLTEMPISSFTEEKMKELMKKKDIKEKEKLFINSKTLKELWVIDLDEVKELLI